MVSCYGESLCFHCIDAKEVLLNLIIDDGSKSGGIIKILRKIIISFSKKNIKFINSIKYF